jgi:hypothetical protein
MASVAFTAFLTDILPAVPACPDLVAVNAARDAAITLCVRSGAWQDITDPAETTALSFPFDLDAPSGARVCKILAAIYDGAPLLPTSQDYLDATQLDWRNRQGQPRLYYQPDAYTVSVFPQPSDTKTFQLRLAFAPLRSATVTDSLLYDVYYEGIVAGAIAKLMNTPGQAYTNPQMAASYAVQFERGVVQAELDASRSFTRTQGRVRALPFA